MNFKTFLSKLILVNIHKYSLFFLSAVFSMSVFFVFANLWFTDGFLENTNEQMHLLMVIAAAITILFSIFIISYVHWYLMKERSKSFSVLLSYGMRRKDLRKMIAGETCIIYFISLLLAFLTGSVFSKLFFLMSVKLLMLEDTGLSYELTFESFTATAFVFALIFAVILFLAFLRMSGKDLMELSKDKRETELKKGGNLWLGCIGILLILGSILALYWHNQNSMKQVSQWVMGAGIFCLLGIYLFISHVSRIIYGGLKKNTKHYYHHLLEASEFAQGFRQNRKTFFILTLLTFGAILFISVTYTLNQEAMHMTEAENPHDLYFQEIDALPVLKGPDFDRLSASYDTALRTKDTLPFLYMNAPDMIINSWREEKWIPVVSETDYNRCFHADYDIPSGEIQQILFESTLDHRTEYFHREVLLKNSSGEYNFQNLRPIYDKILNRYLFTQPLLLITDDLDYQKLKASAGDKESGTLYFYQFEDWRKSRDLCNAFTNLYYETYQVLAETEQVLNDELIRQYHYSHLQVRSKTGYYEATKMQGSFSLFIMGFVSILFCFCILITYCFKVFMNTSEDRERFHKLDGIGMMRKEKKSLIEMRMRFIVFVPAFLGIILNLGWIYALNFNKIIEVELSSVTLVKNAIYTGMIYLAVTFVYYHFLKRAYFRRLGLL